MTLGKKIDWREEAKRELRGIDRATAIRILHAIARFLKTGEGDVKQLQGLTPVEFRLRVGDYRVRFQDYGEFICVISVRHRGQAYR